MKQKSKLGYVTRTISLYEIHYNVCREERIIRLPTSIKPTEFVLKEIDPEFTEIDWMKPIEKVYQMSNNDFIKYAKEVTE